MLYDTLSVLMVIEAVIRHLISHVFIVTSLLLVTEAIDSNHVKIVFVTV